MTLLDSINRLYFNMTVHELSMMNENFNTPNITYNSLLYLDIIAYKEKCTVSYLAKALNISKPAVTIKVNELLKQGFIVKTKSVDDKRINYLTVHQDIMSEFKLYDKVFLKAVNIVEKDYSEEEINIFCKMLKTISDTIIEDN